MSIQGAVHNGVIVPDHGIELPEGARIEIIVESIQTAYPSDLTQAPVSGCVENSPKAALAPNRVSQFEQQSTEHLDADEQLRRIVREMTLQTTSTGFQPATASLAELLRDVHNEPPIDVEQWNRDWAAVEAELNGIPRCPKSVANLSN